MSAKHLPCRTKWGARMTKNSLTPGPWKLRKFPDIPRHLSLYQTETQLQLSHEAKTQSERCPGGGTYHRAVKTGIQLLGFRAGQSHSSIDSRAEVGRAYTSASKSYSLSCKSSGTSSAEIQSLTCNRSWKEKISLRALAPALAKLPHTSYQSSKKSSNVKSDKSQH